jgi:type I restriction enzyme M protein
MDDWGEKVSFIWSIANLLKESSRANQYKDVMLRMTVSRRLDRVLTPTKNKVLSIFAGLKGIRTARAS